MCWSGQWNKSGQQVWKHLQLFKKHWMMYISVQSIYVGLLVSQNVLYLNSVQHSWPIDMTLSFHEFCKSLKRLIFLSV